MPSLRAQLLARFSSRDAIARILISRLFSMPGSTFATPIRAVLITPHRTGSMAASFDSWFVILFVPAVFLGIGIVGGDLGEGKEQQHDAEHDLQHHEGLGERGDGDDIAIADGA